MNPPVDFFHVLGRLVAFFALQKSFSGNTFDDFSVHLFNFSELIIF